MSGTTLWQVDRLWQHSADEVTVEAIRPFLRQVRPNVHCFMQHAADADFGLVERVEHDVMLDQR